jgi:hypothetical protein
MRALSNICKSLFNVGSRRPLERGSTVPVMLAVMAVIMIATLSLARAGRNGIDVASAQTAADAAALAGALDGRAAAESLAGENGGYLIAYDERSDGSVDVTVQVGKATASARALLGYPEDGSSDGVAARSGDLPATRVASSAPSRASPPD